MSTYTLYFHLYDAGGSLTDADSTPVLSDETGSFGLRNASTENVIVADGTAMTKVSTGTYKYVLTYGDAEAADTVTRSTTYAYAVEYVYLGNTYWHEETFTTPASAEATSNLEKDYEDMVSAVNTHFPEYTGSEDAIVQDGYLLFLYPPEVDVNGVRVGSYQWSFLSPVTTLTTTADDYDYDCDAAFGGLVGNAMFIDSDTWRPPITVVSPEEIETWRLGSDATGVPKRVAVRPKEFQPSSGQRWEMVFHPTPDDEYTIRYRYNVNPGAIASGLYALGGLQHTATIRAACLAVAEQRALGQNGPLYAAFLRRLQASIAQDQRFKTRYLGQIEDTAVSGLFFNRLKDTVTFNGVDVDA